MGFLREAFKGRNRFVLRLALALGGLFIVRVPETKGRSLEELERELGASEQQRAGEVPAG